MSLNWDVSKVKKPDLWVKRVETAMGSLREPTEEEMPTAKEYLNPITDGLIWLTMVIDQGDITEKNWKEFYARAKVYELLQGQYFHHGPITLEMIGEHIGLTTNVPTITRAAFLKKVSRWMDEMTPEEV